MASKLADEVASIATYPQFFPTRGRGRATPNSKLCDLCDSSNRVTPPRGGA